MGIEIPGTLQWVAKWVVGAGDWPQGDETAMRRVAVAWEEMATALDGSDTDSERLMRDVFAALTEGKAHDGLLEFWQKIGGDKGELKNLIKRSRSLSNSLDEGATDIEHTKLVIIGALVIFAIQAAAALAQAATGILAPAAAAEEVAARVATQITIRMAIRQLIKRMLSRAAAKAAARAALKGAGWGILQNVGLDAGFRGWQWFEGHRGGLNSKDWQQLGLSALTGGIAGGLGGGLGAGGLGKDATEAASSKLSQAALTAGLDTAANTAAFTASTAATVPFGGKFDFSPSMVTASAAGSVMSAATTAGHPGPATVDGDHPTISQPNTESLTGAKPSTEAPHDQPPTGTDTAAAPHDSNGERAAPDAPASPGPRETNTAPTSTNVDTSTQPGPDSHSDKLVSGSHDPAAPPPSQETGQSGKPEPSSTPAQPETQRQDARPAAPQQDSSPSPTISPTRVSGPGTEFAGSPASSSGYGSLDLPPVTRPGDTPHMVDSAPTITDSHPASTTSPAAHDTPTATVETPRSAPPTAVSPHADIPATPHAPTTESATQTSNPAATPTSSGPGTAASPSSDVAQRPSAPATPIDSAHPTSSPQNVGQTPSPRPETTSTPAHPGTPARGDTSATAPQTPPARTETPSTPTGSGATPRVDNGTSARPDPAQPARQDIPQQAKPNPAQPTWADTAQPARHETAQPAKVDSAQPPRADSTQPTRADAAQPPRQQTAQPAQPIQPHSVQSARTDAAQPARHEAPQSTKADSAQPSRPDTSPSARPDAARQGSPDQLQPVRSDIAQLPRSETPTVKPEPPQPVRPDTAPPARPETPSTRPESVPHARPESVPPSRPETTQPAKPEPTQRLAHEPAPGPRPEATPSVRPDIPQTPRQEVPHWARLDSTPPSRPDVGEPNRPPTRTDTTSPPPDTNRAEPPKYEPSQTHSDQNQPRRTVDTPRAPSVERGSEPHTPSRYPDPTPRRLEVVERSQEPNRPPPDQTTRDGRTGDRAEQSPQPIPVAVSPPHPSSSPHEPRPVNESHRPDESRPGPHERGPHEAPPESEPGVIDRPKLPVEDKQYYANPDYHDPAAERDYARNRTIGPEAADIRARRIAEYPELARLSDAEIELIRRNQQMQFNELLNGGTRNGDRALLDRYDTEIRALVSALNKLPDHDGIVYRSLRIDDPVELAKFLQEYSTEHAPKDLGFASSDKESSMLGGNIELIIESRHGKDISWATGQQQEVVFPPGNQFLVKNRRQVGDKLYIELLDLGRGHDDTGGIRQDSQSSTGERSAADTRGPGMVESAAPAHRETGTEGPPHRDRGSDEDLAVVGRVGAEADRAGTRPDERIAPEDPAQQQNSPAPEHVRTPEQRPHTDAAPDHDGRPAHQQDRPHPLREAEQPNRSHPEPTEHPTERARPDIRRPEEPDRPAPTRTERPESVTPQPHPTDHPVEPPRPMPPQRAPESAPPLWAHQDPNRAVNTDRLPDWWPRADRSTPAPDSPPATPPHTTRAPESLPPTSDRPRSPAPHRPNPESPRPPDSHTKPVPHQPHSRTPGPHEVDQPVPRPRHAPDHRAGVPNRDHEGVWREPSPEPPRRPAAPERRPADPVAEGARNARESYRTRRPEDNRVVDVPRRGTHDTPAYEMRRYAEGPEHIAVVRVRIHLATGEHISPRQLHDLMENTHWAADRAFNTGHKLLSGDWLMVDVEFTNDPSTAHLFATVDHTQGPGTWHPGDRPETLVDRIREQLGLPDTGPHTLDPVDIRQISNDIARANTPAKFRGLPDDRVFGQHLLQPLEDPAFQAAVEDALRDGNRFLVAADPRTNPYGALINDHGMDQPGRNNNCLDLCLAALSAHHGDPQVGVPRWLDLLPDGKLDTNGELGGADRAASYLGRDWASFGNRGLSIREQFQQLHDYVAQMGPGSSALVGNYWHAWDPRTGTFVYDNGLPVVQGAHATVLVYPHDADGPVWWDPQSSHYSDHPPAYLTDRSAYLQFIVNDANGGPHGARTDSNAGGSPAVSGPHLPVDPGVPHLPERVRLGLPEGADAGRDGGRGGDGPEQLRDRRTDGSSDRGPEPAPTDSGRDVRRGDPDRPTGPAKPDLPTQVAHEHRTDTGRPAPDHLPGRNDLPDRTTGTESRQPVGDHQQADHGVRPDRQDHDARGGLGRHAEPTGRDLAEPRDLRVLDDRRDTTLHADSEEPTPAKPLDVPLGGHADDHGRSSGDPDRNESDGTTPSNRDPDRPHVERNTDPSAPQRFDEVNKQWNPPPDYRPETPHVERNTDPNVPRRFDEINRQWNPPQGYRPDTPHVERNTDPNAPQRFDEVNKQWNPPRGYRPDTPHIERDSRPVDERDSQTRESVDRERSGPGDDRPVPPGMYRGDDGQLRKPGDRLDSYRDPDGRWHHRDDAPGTYRDVNFQLRKGSSWVRDHLTETDVVHFAESGPADRYQVVSKELSDRLDALAAEAARQDAARAAEAAAIKPHMKEFGVQKIDELSANKLREVINSKQQEILRDKSLTEADRLAKLDRLYDMQDIARRYNDLGPQMNAVSKEMGEVGGIAHATERDSSVLLTPFKDARDGRDLLDVTSFVQGENPTLVANESKGGGSPLEAADTAKGRAQQGSPEYFERTVAIDKNLERILLETPEQMRARGVDPNGPEGRKLLEAREALLRAHADGTLKFEYNKVRVSRDGTITVSRFRLDRDGEPPTIEVIGRVDRAMARELIRAIDARELEESIARAIEEQRARLLQQLDPRQQEIVLRGIAQAIESAAPNKAAEHAEKQLADSLAKAREALETDLQRASNHIEAAQKNLDLVRDVKYEQSVAALRGLGLDPHASQIAERLLAAELVDRQRATAAELAVAHKDLVAEATRRVLGDKGPESLAREQALTQADGNIRELAAAREQGGRPDLAQALEINYALEQAVGVEQQQREVARDMRAVQDLGLVPEHAHEVMDALAENREQTIAQVRDSLAQELVQQHNLIVEQNPALRIPELNARTFDARIYALCLEHEPIGFDREKNAFVYQLPGRAPELVPYGSTARNLADAVKAIEKGVPTQQVGIATLVQLGQGVNPIEAVRAAPDADTLRRRARDQALERERNRERER
ncbi:toxin glutamine deamidase domain-containing protein [Nocardia sp. JCM 34519]|uniref:toxin glutamine deamidase domain-containing protein n=1 Tax=Nocardia sp. JCM 34519 TaxID=2876118 RepID=UPI001CE3CDA7|nr:toxin glutamine deamidase domain-containing protein [Nocardia sp. JCM 34519]